MFSGNLPPPAPVSVNRQPPRANNLKASTVEGLSVHRPAVLEWYRSLNHAGTPKPGSPSGHLRPGNQEPEKLASPVTSSSGNRAALQQGSPAALPGNRQHPEPWQRSEEHTSELQSLMRIS